jgi:hypothetical protein
MPAHCTICRAKTENKEREEVILTSSRSSPRMLFSVLSPQSSVLSPQLSLLSHFHADVLIQRDAFAFKEVGDFAFKDFSIDEVLI